MPCVYRSQAQPPLWNSVTDACVGARCGTFVVFYIYLQKRWPFIADSLWKFSYPGHGFFVTLPWKTFFSLSLVFGFVVVCIEDTCLAACALVGSLLFLRPSFDTECAKALCLLYCT